MIPSPPKATPHPLLVIFLVCNLGFGLLSMAICLPSMQEWGELFATDQASVQLTFSGFVVAFGAMQLLYGPLSDQLGRKRVLLFGMALATVSAFGAALAHDVGTLTLARVLQGAGCAAGTVVVRAMVQDLFQGPDRTRVMAYIGMAMGLSPPLATVLGGQLHVRFGWQANFQFLTVMGLCLLLAGWTMLPNRGPTVAAQGHWLRSLIQSYVRLAGHRAFVLYVIVLAMTTATFYAFLSGAPIVLKHYGVKPDGLGYYIMCIPVSYAAGNFISARWNRRRGDRAMMILGQAASVGSILLMLAAALAGLSHPLAMALPLVGLGIGHGILVPPTLSGSIGVMPALAGAAAAVAGLMQQFTGAAAGYAIGLMRHDNAVHLGLLMLSLTLVATVAMFLVLRDRAGPAKP